MADILNPWQRSCTRLLVPRPQQVSTAWHTVFKPLSPVFWALVFSASILSACSITTLSYLASMMPSRAKDIAKITFGDSCFEAVSLLIVGMGDQIRGSRELRLVQVSWALFAVIFAAAYSSSLASILTTPSEEEVPQKLVELVEKGYVWFNGIESLNNPEFAFKTQSGVDKRWLQLQVSDADLLGGKTTILGEEIHGHFFMNKMDVFTEKFLHKFMVSKECLAANHISIITRKRSSYFEFLSEGFSRLAETGILNKMLSDVLKSPQIKKSIVTETSRQRVIPRGIPLSLGQLRGAFYILIFGNAVALIIFIWEINPFSIKIYIKNRNSESKEMGSKSVRSRASCITKRKSSSPSPHK